MNVLGRLPLDLKKNVMKFLPVGPPPVYLTQIREGRHPFTNVEEMARRDQFLRPNIMMIAGLKDFFEVAAFLGNTVYLKIGHSHEWFWVEVHAIHGENITGTIANTLVRAPFDLNEEVTFKKKHILDWQIQ